MKIIETAIPVAVVNRTSWRPILKVAAPVIVAMAGFFAYKAIKPLLRSDWNRALEARQDNARKHVGHGLDDLFERQLDANDNQVELDARFETSPEISGDYSAIDCAHGFQEAFDDVLEQGTVVVVPPIGSHASEALVLAGTIEPTDRVMQLQHSPETYPEIRLRATMTLAGKTVEATVEPSAELRVTYSRATYDLDSKATAADVAAAMIRNTCAQAGFAFLESLTEWRRPEPTLRRSPEKLCEEGFGCREAAAAIETTDPSRAIELYGRACEDKDEVACDRGLTIALEQKHRGGSIALGDGLRMGCSSRRALACISLGMYWTLPYSATAKPLPDDLEHALAAFLAACDLGDREGCRFAAPLLADSRFAAALPLLDGTKTSVTTRTFGKIFAIHSSSLFRLGHDRQTAIWVTDPPSSLPKGMISIPFVAVALPPGLAAPKGATEVYAITASNHFDFEACRECTADTGPPRAFFEPSCVCVLGRQRQPTSNPIE